MKERIDHLLWGTDLQATRFTLAIAAMFTGLMLILKPNYWIDGLFSPYVMGLLFLIQGVVLGVSILNGRKLGGIYADAILGCMLWSYICVTNLLLDAWHYSDAAHIALALASWWSLVRWSKEL